MDKKEIAAVFEEIGTLLDLQGANPFRVRAYANAARTIESLQQDLDTLVKEGRLTEIKGIGEDLARKITELHTTGKLAFYDELKASLPAGLFDMLRIPGFGPKRAKIVYEKLGVDSLESSKLPAKPARSRRWPVSGRNRNGKFSMASNSRVSSAAGIIATRRVPSPNRSSKRYADTTA